MKQKRPEIDDFERKNIGFVSKEKRKNFNILRKYLVLKVTLEERFCILFCFARECKGKDVQIIINPRFYFTDIRENIYETALTYVYESAGGANY